MSFYIFNQQRHRADGTQNAITLPMLQSCRTQGCDAYCKSPLKPRAFQLPPPRFWQARVPFAERLIFRLPGSQRER